jgi:hypothetical protein
VTRRRVLQLQKSEGEKVEEEGANNTLGMALE